jgi:predicted RNase H-like HicB family nuclease
MFNKCSTNFNKQKVLTAMYRIGYPAWKLLARFGVPVVARINVHHDTESNSLWADSPDLDGLVVSGQTLDELHREAISAAGELIQLALKNHKTRAHADIRLHEVVLGYT